MGKIGPLPKHTKFKAEFRAYGEPVSFEFRSATTYYLWQLYRGLNHFLVTYRLVKLLLWESLLVAPATGAGDEDLYGHLYEEVGGG